MANHHHRIHSKTIRIAAIISLITLASSSAFAAVTESRIAPGTIQTNSYGNPVSNFNTALELGHYVSSYAVAQQSSFRKDMVIATNGTTSFYGGALSKPASGQVIIGGGAIGANAVSVNGLVTAKEIRVQATVFPDYVFADDYKLLSLDAVEAAIKRDRHLPGVPAAAEIEKDGLPVSQIVVKQMEKIEELTLHAIALNKANLALQADLQRANERLAAIEARLAQQDGR